MLLIDSLYINNSGGKILLNYLVQELEKDAVAVFYLFDARCINDYQSIPDERKSYLRASLLQRHKFYQKNKHKFSKVLCFGNLAPSIRLQVPVYTYFHQLLFLVTPRSLVFKQKVIINIKKIIFKYLLKNTDYIILQTSNISRELQTKIPNFSEDRIKILPFYEPLHYPPLNKIKNTFLFVSAAHAHKNHDFLLAAFAKFYDASKQGELILTIPVGEGALNEKIKTLQKSGYPIVNLGVVAKEEIARHYATAEYIVYPSLAESLGLGIIEGLEANCKIIGADLPYMHVVCEPSLVFNPYCIDDLVLCFQLCLTTNVKPSKQKVFNCIAEINHLITV